jgi:hypothetical protein
MPRNLKPYPTIHVLYCTVHPPAPNEAAVLLQKCFERRTARASVKPNGNFVHRRSYGRLKDEVHLLTRVVPNGNLPRIELAWIICDIRKSIDSVTYSMSIIDEAQLTTTIKCKHDQKKHSITFDPTAIFAEFAA